MSAYDGNLIVHTQAAKLCMSLAAFLYLSSETGQVKKKQTTPNDHYKVQN